MKEDSAVAAASGKILRPVHVLILLKRLPEITVLDNDYCMNATHSNTRDRKKQLLQMLHSKYKKHL